MEFGDEISRESDAFYRVLAVEDKVRSIDAKSETELLGGEASANGNCFNGCAQRVSFVRLIVERFD